MRMRFIKRLLCEFRERPLGTPANHRTTVILRKGNWQTKVLQSRPFYEGASNYFCLVTRRKMGRHRGRPSRENLGIVLVLVLVLDAVDFPPPKEPDSPATIWFRWSKGEISAISRTRTTTSTSRSSQLRSLR